MNFYESIKKNLNEANSKNRRMNLIKYSSNGYTDVSKTDGEYKGEPLVNYHEKDFKKGTSVLTPFICYDCDAGFYVKSSIHDFFQQGDFDDPYEIPKGEFLYCPKCKSNNIDCNGYPLIKEPGVKETITEADDSYMKEWRSICEAFCKKIGAELLFVNTDNFGYTDKDGNNVHMYADELEQFIKNGGLKESDESGLTCFACGRPTTDRDDNNKPVCSECYSYISDLVGHGEWIEEEYHEKATYDDFKDFSPYWRKYFETLAFEDIPWDALTDEAYEIYMRMPHSF